MARTSTTPPDVSNVEFDQKGQYDQIVPWLVGGEKLYAVYDLKGSGTGFIAVTNKPADVLRQGLPWEAQGSHETDEPCTASRPEGRVCRPTLTQAKKRPPTEGVVGGREGQRTAIEPEASVAREWAAPFGR